MATTKPARVDLAKLRTLAHRLITVTVDTDLNDQLADLTIAEGRALDAMAFECVGCELWYAAHERKVVKEKWLCRECAREAGA
jgi:hypothetical protein